MVWARQGPCPVTGMTAQTRFASDFPGGDRLADTTGQAAPRQAGRSQDALLPAPAAEGPLPVPGEPQCPLPSHPKSSEGTLPGAGLAAERLPLDRWASKVLEPHPGLRWEGESGRTKRGAGGQAGSRGTRGQNQGQEQRGQVRGPGAEGVGPRRWWDGGTRTLALGVSLTHHSPGGPLPIAAYGAATIEAGTWLRVCLQLAPR